jgi:hypothetical protein
LTPLISSLLAVLSSPGLAADLGDRASLELQWNNEEIYFVPARATKGPNWTGMIYRYSDGACFSVEQGEKRTAPAISRVRGPGRRGMPSGTDLNI